MEKKIRAKWTGAMAQVIDSLLCKYEALSSNPSSTKCVYICMSNMYIPQYTLYTYLMYIYIYIYLDLSMECPINNLELEI
jgi:hypothetical protein